MAGMINTCRNTPTDTVHFTAFHRGFVWTYRAGGSGGHYKREQLESLLYYTVRNICHIWSWLFIEKQYRCEHGCATNMYCIL